MGASKDLSAFKAGLKAAKNKAKGSRKQGIVGMIGSTLSRVGRSAPKWLLYGTSIVNAASVIMSAVKESGGDINQLGQRLTLKTTGIGSDGKWYWQEPAKTYGGTIIPAYIARKL